MKYFKNEIKLFVNQTIPLFLFITGFVFVFLYMIYRLFHLGLFSNYTPIYTVFSSTRQYSYIFFLIVGLVSMLFFSLEKDQNVEELIFNDTIKQRKFRLWIFLCLIFLYTIIIICFVMSFCLIKINPYLPKNYIVALLFQLLYDYLGTGVLSVLFSYVISYFTNKLGRIIIFMIIHFVIGYPFILFSDLLSLSILHIPFFNVCLDFLSVLPDGFQYGLSDSYSIVFIQPHHVVLLLCWIFLLLLLKNIIEKNRIFSAICGLFAFLFLFLFLLPWTAIYPGHRRSEDLSWVKQSPIYNSNCNDVSLFTNSEKIAVQEYDIQLNAFFFPTFDVKMVLNKKSAGEIAFTLQRGFKIQSITDDEGNTLNWIRKDDYFKIMPSKEIDTIYLSYYGDYGSFNSDVSSIFFKPGTPFFPIPGINNVYDKSDFYSMKYWEINRLDNLAHFKVKVNTLGTVISSLPTVSYNTFEGDSDSFFLLKGMYDTVKIDDTIIIYPYAAEEVLNASNIEITKEYLDFYWEEFDTDRNTKLILVGYINSINTREIERYNDFACISTFYYLDNRKKNIMDYYVIEELK